MRFDAGLLRNISTELYHMLIMLTRGRAQRLVLKAKEPERLEAYRLLLRRYKPVSTVTIVPKLVDVLATTFCGDLMDSLTDFERRVASWEYDAKETELINIGVVIKGLENGSFRDHLLITTAGTMEWTKYVKEIENVEVAPRKHPACSDEFVGDGQSRSQVPRKLFMVWNLRSHGERLSNGNLILAKQPMSGWYGTAKTKGKPGKGKDKQDKGKGKGKLGNGKRQEQEQRKG